MAIWTLGVNMSIQMFFKLRYDVVYIYIYIYICPLTCFGGPSHVWTFGSRFYNFHGIKFLFAFNFFLLQKNKNKKRNLDLVFFLILGGDSNSQFWATFDFSSYMQNTNMFNAKKNWTFISRKKYILQRLEDVKIIQNSLFLHYKLEYMFQDSKYQNKIKMWKVNLKIVVVKILKLL